MRKKYEKKKLKKENGCSIYITNYNYSIKIMYVNLDYISINNNKIIYILKQINQFLKTYIIYIKYFIHTNYIYLLTHHIAYQ